jgi:hypothetical protein
MGMDLLHKPPSLSLTGKNMFGFPTRMLGRLRYVDTLLSDTTSGAIRKQVFRLNSTYDPDLTNAGHQPLYRDTYATIYDQYAVVRCRAIVTVVNAGTVPIHCGIVLEDDSSSSTSYNVLMEMTAAQHKLVPAQLGSLSSHTFVYDWDCQKVLGIDPFASETYKTAVGSNPTEESDLVVWVQPVDLASTQNHYINIELQQEVLWTELSTPTIS